MNKVSEVETERGQSWAPQAVHRWIAQCTLRLSRSWQSHVHLRKGGNKQLFKKGEVEYKKFDGNGVSVC